MAFVLIRESPRNRLLKLEDFVRQIKFRSSTIVIDKVVINVHAFLLLYITVVYLVLLLLFYISAASCFFLGFSHEQ